MNPAWFDRVEEFEFFAFVRLCERVCFEATRAQPGLKFHAIGVDAPPARESLRFHVDPSVGFPVASISSAQPAASRAIAENAPVPVDMDVTFFGCIGSSGVLPENYCAIVLQRMRMQDHVLQSFLDLFHHRLISQFYRAWCKQHFVAHVERSRLSGEQDVFTTALYSLAGLGAEEFRGRMTLPDDVFLQYVGHFSHRPRTASALRQMLSDYFQLPVTVQQFRGRWLEMAEEDRTRLPDANGIRGQSYELGKSAILGERLWDVQTMIRLRIGPVTAEQFEMLLPSSPMLVQLTEFTRAYLGPELDFDLQLVLHRDQVRPLQLGMTNPRQRLGQNCWLGIPRQKSLVDDAVFFMSDR